MTNGDEPNELADEISRFLSKNVGTFTSLPLEVDAAFFKDQECNVCGSPATFVGQVSTSKSDGVLLCDTCTSLIVLRDADSLAARFEIKPDEERDDYLRLALEWIHKLQEFTRPSVDGEHQT